VRRVLLVHQPTDGGVGRHVTDLAIGLEERGFRAVLCGPSRPVGLPGSCAHIRLDLRRSIAPRADSATILRLARVIGEVRPALVHAHSSKAGAVVRLAKPLHPRTPVVYTPHGYAFAGHFSRELERSAYREIERLLARLADRVVCVCEAEARLARTVGPAERVRVVHNGIEPAGAGPVDRRVAELAQDGPVVCALTLLRPGKGIETLLDALPEVLARRPRARIAIGGDGPDLQALRARARRLGVAGAVNFLGRSPDPLSLLRGAHAFVHPSWAESFPYVILEAMSLGLPIVASDVGGVSEAVSDGESGALVTPGDARALARALIELLGDSGAGARMGAAAKLRFEQRFTRARMIGGVADVYEEAIRRAPVQGLDAR
jgi:glycosyltransferase involved in cell wall biosynthesis